MKTLTRSPLRSGQHTAGATPRPRRSRRRTILVVAVGIGAAVAGAFMIGGGTSDPMPMTPLHDAQVAGVFEFEVGQRITLLGSEQHLSYERDDTIAMLTPAASDTYVASDDPQEVITLERDTDATVVGLEIRRAGEPAEVAVRLHAYVEHDVTFTSGGERLAGSLLVPTAPGPHPAVVIVHGAERRTRETYRLLASHYARQGVAALIYDKRGLGESTGDVASASFEDLTDDALAGLAYLRARADIDPDRVGVAGFSQGGWIAALAALRTDEVAFVVAYSASGYSPADQNAWLYGNMLAVRGLGPRAIATAERFQRTLYSTLDLVESGRMRPIPHVPGFWFHALDLHLDTNALWEEVRQPVLGIWGALDCQVPAHDSAHAFRDALDRGGNPHYALRVLDGADHGLTITGPCLHELGIHGHSRMRYASGYLPAGAAWILDLDEGPRREYDVPPPGADGSLAWHHEPPTAIDWPGRAFPQMAAIALLLAGFGAVVLRSLAAALRRGARAPRLVAVTAVVGFAATVVGFAALGELASLGGIHARLLVGAGPVAGTTPLLAAAGLLVTVTACLVAAVVASRRAGDAGARWPVVVTVGATVLLTVWATYWQIPWLPGGII